MAQHTSKHAHTHAITANRLRDGGVVYYTAQDTWADDFAEAAICQSGQAADDLLAAANKHTAIIDIYLFDVADNQPSSVRERIRAQGPTVGFVGQ